MKNLATITYRVKYGEYYYLIVPCIASGHRSYSVLKVRSNLTIGKAGGTRVIGRELDLKCARKIVKKLNNDK